MLTMSMKETERANRRPWMSKFCPNWMLGKVKRKKSCLTPQLGDINNAKWDTNDITAVIFRPISIKFTGRIDFPILCPAFALRITRNKTEHSLETKHSTEVGCGSISESAKSSSMLTFFELAFSALGQPEMVHYYPQYSTPYLVPQQVHLPPTS